MRVRTVSKFLAFLFIVFIFSNAVFAEVAQSDENITMDRIQLVSQQIDLLKKRIKQNEHQLNDLNAPQNNSNSQLEKVNKNLLDKVNLEISVIKSDLDSINIELDDSTQSISWLEKNIQEIENQLNIMTMFNLKTAQDELANVPMLQSDLAYQKQLIKLEKIRHTYLQRLQVLANNTLQIKRDYYNRLNAMMRSRRLLQMKQHQVKDELQYQEQQNQWLQKLNVYMPVQRKWTPRARMKLILMLSVKFSMQVKMQILPMCNL